MTCDGAANAVRFEQVHRAMGLFAQGLTGRPQAVQMSGDAAADAAAIRLPAVMDAFAARRENHGAVRLAVLRQMGRDLDPQTDFGRWRRPRLLRRVFTQLEGLRVDTAIARRYPGARADLERARSRALARRPRVPDATRPLQAALDGLARFALGATRCELESEPMRHVLDIATAVQAKTADVRDSLRAALAICACLDASSPMHPARPLTTVTTDLVTEDPADRLAAGRSNAEATGGNSTSGDAAAGSWGASLAFSAEPATEGADKFKLRPGASTRPVPAAEPGPTHFHDEWDCLARRYLPDWCQVREYRLHGDDMRFLHALRERHATLRSQVRRQFAGIRPALRERMHRVLDGDEIDIDGAVEEAIGRRAGHLAEGRVFMAQRRPRRDVCAAFLVDMSGSTGFLVPEPPGELAPTGVDDEDDDYFYQPRAAARAVAQRPPRRRVIDIAADALGLMCDALHELGDRHAVYGFSGEGRHDVRFHIAKSFADPWSARTAAALAAMRPMGATRTGAAIRHAITRLTRESARTRVLIVVSDGYPQDTDYGPDPRNPAYAIQDTARALREAEQVGISTFCIAIDPAGHDYLRTMCDAGRYLVIDDVSALPAQLGKVYRALTAR